MEGFGGKKKGKETDSGIKFGSLKYILDMNYYLGIDIGTRAARLWSLMKTDISNHCHIVNMT